MEEIKVTAEARQKIGIKGALSGFRSQQKIPAVVYGDEKPPVSVLINEKDLGHLLKAGSNSIIELSLPDGSTKAILKNIQRHVVTNRPIHIDLQRVSMQKKLEVLVPIKLTGEAPAVKASGAILDYVTREIRLRCLPNDIPHDIPVDISTLDMGNSITLKDVALPAGVEMMDEPSKIVAHLMMPKEEEEAKPAEAAAGATPEQPEVIAKGKKDEEEGEKAEAAPQPGKTPQPGKK